MRNVIAWLLSFVMIHVWSNAIKTWYPPKESLEHDVGKQKLFSNNEETWTYPLKNCILHYKDLSVSVLLYFTFRVEEAKPWSTLSSSNSNPLQSSPTPVIHVDTYPDWIPRNWPFSVVAFHEHTSLKPRIFPLNRVNNLFTTQSSTNFMGNIKFGSRIFNLHERN